jgi:predicted neutral ceramidase superfamily lipid hydrolase
VWGIAGHASISYDMSVRYRRLVLAAALVMIVYLAILTGWVAASSGPDVLTALSLLILAVLGIGISGAMRHPPD